MNRVCGNVCVLATKYNPDNDEIMNVLQVISNGFFGVSRIAVLDYQISCGSNGNFVGNMSRQDELAIVPSNLNLLIISIMPVPDSIITHTLFPRM